MKSKILFLSLTLLLVPAFILGADVQVDQRDQQIQALTARIATLEKTVAAPKSVKLHADRHIQAGVAAGIATVAVLGASASAQGFVADLGPDTRAALTAGALLAGTQATTGITTRRWNGLSNATQFLGFTGAAVTTAWALQTFVGATTRVATRLKSIN